jgi:hypothetical protein
MTLVREAVGFKSILMIDQATIERILEAATIENSYRRIRQSETACGANYVGLLSFSQ